MTEALRTHEMTLTITPPALETLEQLGADVLTLAGIEVPAHLVTNGAPQGDQIEPDKTKWNSQ